MKETDQWVKMTETHLGNVVRKDLEAGYPEEEVYRLKRTQQHKE